MPYMSEIHNCVGTISASVIVRTEGVPIPPITLALIGATRSDQKLLCIKVLAKIPND